MALLRMKAVRFPYHHFTALLFLLAFIAFKWQYVGLPLYWDEAWVYGPAVKAMCAKGLSLLPDTIGTELTRGHPLLFHFMAALWAKVFGASNVSLHLFALCIAAALLLSTYVIGSRLGSPLIGLGAMVLLGLNEIFLAQSGLLLPEVTVGLFMLWALWFFIAGKFARYCLMASCALLVKESAIVLILAVFCWQVVVLLVGMEERGHGRIWLRLFTILSPLLPISLFISYQKLTYGWFFFPAHMGLLSFAPKDIEYLFRFGYEELFERQGMEWATLAFGIIAPLVWKGWRKRYSGVITVLLYIAAIKVLCGRWPLEPALTVIAVCACFTAVIFIQFIPLSRQEGKRGAFPASSFILIVGFLLFSAVNFFSDRYLTGLIPFVAIGMVAVIYSATRPWHWSIFAAVFLAILGNVAMNLGRGTEVGDTKLSYRNDILATKAMIAYCEAAHLQHARFFGSFMDVTYMQDANAGYLGARQPFVHVKDRLAPDTEYALVSQASTGDVLDQLMSAGFVEVKRVESGPAWCALYAKKPAVPGFN